jgi:hypothetical protein
MDEKDLYVLALKLKERADKEPLDLSKPYTDCPEPEIIFIGQEKYGIVFERIQSGNYHGYCLHIVNNKEEPPADSVCQQIVRIFLANAVEVELNLKGRLRQFLKEIEFYN